MIELTGFELTYARIFAIIAEEQPVRISKQAIAKLKTNRNIVLETTQSVYGLNTGVGQNKDLSIQSDLLVQFNQNLVTSHLIGTGPLLSPRLSKIILLIRINQLAQGYTGISPEIPELLMQLFNQDVIPALPSYGSIGEADIGILSYLAEVVSGQGQVWLAGRLVKTSVAFEQLNIQPITLGPKDALSLLSSNTYGIGQAVAELDKLQKLMQLQTQTLALSMVALDANITPILKSVLQANHNAYQNQAANDLKALLKPSVLWNYHVRRQVQDPISFRSATHIAGAIGRTIANAITVIDDYLQGSDDNPMVDAKSGFILSTGNFEVIDVALALETVIQGITHLSRTIVQRIKHLNNPEITALPRFLIQQDGTQFGLQTLQKLAVDLDVRIRQLAYPISNEFYGLAGDIEDHQSNLPLIGASLRQINKYLQTLLALELYNAIQALYLRYGSDAAKSLGTELGDFYTEIRKTISPITSDRQYGQDIQTLEDWLADYLATSDLNRSQN
jgi:histidine ammonia-lyase